jgi:hypothetical protein
MILATIMRHSPQFFRRFFLMGLFFFAGCAYDLDMPANKTKGRLSVLGRVLLKYPQERATSFITVKELVAAGVKDGLLLDLPNESLDFWGSEFVLQSNREKNATVVKIISSGPNKTFERGEGDDLFVEVRFEAGRVPEMRLKPQR